MTLVEVTLIICFAAHKIVSQDCRILHPRVQIAPHAVQVVLKIIRLLSSQVAILLMR